MHMCKAKKEERLIMKKTKKTAVIICGIVFVLIVAGLIWSGATRKSSIENIKLTYGRGASSYADDRYMADSKSDGDFGLNAMIMNKEELVMEAAKYDDAPAPAMGNGSAPALTDGKKLKKTYNYTVETTEYDDYKKEIADKVSSLGGYMEQQQEYVDQHQNKSMTETYSVREMNYTIRVPSDRIGELLSIVSSADVVSSNEYVEDVTTQYIDLETHIAALRDEYGILEKLLQQASSVTEIIEVQDRLSDINYEIGSYEKSMEQLAKDIDYSKLYLRVDEVVYYQDTVVRFTSDITRRWYDMFEEYMSYAFPVIVLFVMTILPVVILLGFVAVFFGRMIAKNKSKFQQTVILKREDEANKAEEK